jgi:hypothetical protein
MTILEFIALVLPIPLASLNLSPISTRFAFLVSLSYNINPTAYSRLGSKHSEDSKELMRINNLGDKNPMFGKSHSDEYKAIIRKVHSIPLYVYDAKTKLLLSKYDTQKEFIKVFKVSPKTVIKYVNTGNIFRDQYILSNTLSDKISIG